MQGTAHMDSTVSPPIVDDALSIQSEHKLEIESIAGHGSSADVYLAKVVGDSISCKARGEKVILKVLKNNTSAADAMLKNEVKVLTALQGHPNVLKFFGMYLVNDGIEDENVILPCGAMQLEYCSQGDLHDAVTRSRLSEDEGQHIMRGILSGLAHIHEKGYVHRDIKPENVFMMSDRTVRIADFGICCEISNETEMKRKCGSLGYCAPEMLQGKSYCTKVDIFSAGALLYFILSGKMAFSGSSIISTMKRTIVSPVNFQKSVRLERLSNDCKEFLEELLVKNPANRPSAQEASQNVWISHSTRPRTSISAIVHDSVLPEDINLVLQTQGNYITEREHALAQRSISRPERGASPEIVPRSPQQRESTDNFLDQAVHSKVGSDRFSDLSTVCASASSERTSKTFDRLSSERSTRESEVNGRVDRKSFIVKLDDTQMLSEQAFEPTRPQGQPSTGRGPFSLRIRRSRACVAQLNETQETRLSQ